MDSVTLRQGSASRRHRAEHLAGLGAKNLAGLRRGVALATAAAILVGVVAKAGGAWNLPLDGIGSLPRMPAVTQEETVVRLHGAAARVRSVLSAEAGLLEQVR